MMRASPDLGSTSKPTDGSDKAPAPIDFDVSRLLRRNLRSSGITRYAAHMLFELRELHPDFRAVVFGDEETVRGCKDIDEASACLGLPIKKVRGEVADRILFSPHGPLPTEFAVYPSRVITIHDCFHVTRQAYYFDHPTGGQYTREIMASINPITDFVVCDSAFTLADFLKCRLIDRERGFVVPLGAAPCFSPSASLASAAFLKMWELDGKRYFVVWCTQDDPRKNVSGTIVAVSEATRCLGKTGPTPVFVAGSGNKDQISRLLGAPDQGVIMSNLRDEDFAALYRNASFFVFTPLLEGFGLPLLEAMSCGCPTIASSAASVAEVGGDACLYADPRVPDSIAAAIVSLARNDSLRRLLASRSLTQASYFSWRRTAALTSAVIERAAAVSRQRKRLSWPLLKTLDLLPGREFLSALSFVNFGKIDAVRIIFDQGIDGAWSMQGGSLELDSASYENEWLVNEDESSDQHRIRWDAKGIDSDCSLLIQTKIRPLGRECATLRIKAGQKGLAEVVIGLQEGRVLKTRVEGVLSSVVFFASDSADGRVSIVGVARRNSNISRLTVLVSAQETPSGSVSYCGDGRIAFAVSETRVALIWHQHTAL